MEDSNAHRLKKKRRAKPRNAQKKAYLDKILLLEVSFVCLILGSAIMAIR